MHVVKTPPFSRHICKVFMEKGGHMFLLGYSKRTLYLSKF